MFADGKRTADLLIRIYKRGVRLLKKASLTVETAIVFPLFFFSVVALIYMIMWFSTAENIQKGLVNEARTVAALSYTHLHEENDEEEITLYRNYFMKMECPVLSLVKLKLKQGVYMRRFTGVDYISDEEDSEIVYITANGSVYHRNSACTYIKVSTEKVLYSDIGYKRNKSGSKYRRCTKCIGKNYDITGPDKVVYISRYGNHYHITDTCTAISRNVMAVKLNEVYDRRVCSKCG